MYIDDRLFTHHTENWNLKRRSKENYSTINCLSKGSPVTLNVNLSKSYLRMLFQTYAVFNDTVYIFEFMTTVYEIAVLVLVKLLYIC